MAGTSSVTRASTTKPQLPIDLVTSGISSNVNPVQTHLTEMPTDSESDPDFKNGAVVVDEPKKKARKLREERGPNEGKRRSDILNNISSMRSRTRSKVTKDSRSNRGGTYERMLNPPILT